jgi:hypothetical protein
MLKRLEKSQGKLHLDAVELTPSRDGRSAYVVMNNEGDLGENLVSQSYAYKVDAQGAHKLFSTTGRYLISEVVPLGNDRIIYLRLSDRYPRKGDLRIYDLSTKSSKPLIADVATSAVWAKE